MTRAKQYHMNFAVGYFKSGTPIPYILHDTDENGHTLVPPELLSFIGGGGVLRMQQILDDLNGYDYNNHEFTEEGDARIEGAEEEYGTIISPPPRMRFYDYDIPMDHFIEIIHEWMVFLNRLPPNHYLAKR